MKKKRKKTLQDFLTSVCTLKTFIHSSCYIIFNLTQKVSGNLCVRILNIRMENNGRLLKVEVVAHLLVVGRMVVAAALVLHE